MSPWLGALLETWDGVRSFANHWSPGDHWPDPRGRNFAWNRHNYLTLVQAEAFA